MIGSWSFNIMCGIEWRQLVVSLTDDTIKWQIAGNPFQTIKLKHTVKEDHIPIINKYASYVRLNECRHTFNGSLTGDTIKCKDDLVEFINMLAEVSLETLLLEKWLLEYCIENAKLREENELLKEYKKKKD